MPPFPSFAARLRRARRLRRGLRLVAAALLALAAAGLAVARLAPPVPAGAAVGHVQGYRATVDGFTSWYGSYDLGTLGVAWCVDHGIRAPDPALAYVATDLAEQPATVRTALAWAFGRHGPGADRVTAAALMLAGHDLMGARYPSGPLDVDALVPSRLAGFGGDTGAVLARARAIAAEARARSSLRGPLALSLALDDPAPGATGTARARLVDAAGAPVPGIAVQVVVAGAPAGSAATGPDGVAAVAFRAPPGEYRVRADAVVPDLVPDAYRPTRAAAQRVVRPRTRALSAEAAAIAEPLGRLVVRKHGDAEPYLPIAGARFEVRTVPGGVVVTGPDQLVVGGDGRTPSVTLPAGTYAVVEVAAPPGYDLAGPWTVVVPPDAELVLDVTDPARRGGVALRKLDAETLRPVAGARFEVWRDADLDGEHETRVAEVVSEDGPVTIGDLLPGPYRVLEVAAPAGYELPADPFLDVVVRGGEVIEATLADRRLPPPATTTTTAPPTTVPPTTAPPTTVPPTSPPSVAATAATVPRSATLPRTGPSSAGALASAGTGLVLAGVAARLGAAAHRRRPVHYRPGPHG